MILKRFLSIILIAGLVTNSVLPNNFIRIADDHDKDFAAMKAERAEKKEKSHKLAIIAGVVVLCAGAYASYFCYKLWSFAQNYQPQHQANNPQKPNPPAQPQPPVNPAWKEEADRDYQEAMSKAAAVENKGNIQMAESIRELAKQTRDFQYLMASKIV